MSKFKYIASLLAAYCCFTSPYVKQRTILERALNDSKSQKIVFFHDSHERNIDLQVADREIEIILDSYKKANNSAFIIEGYDLKQNKLSQIKSDIDQNAWWDDLSVRKLNKKLYDYPNVKFIEQRMFRELIRVFIAILFTPYISEHNAVYDELTLRLKDLNFSCAELIASIEENLKTLRADTNKAMRLLKTSEYKLLKGKQLKRLKSYDIALDLLKGILSSYNGTSCFYELLQKAEKFSEELPRFTGISKFKRLEADMAFADFLNKIDQFLEIFYTDTQLKKFETLLDQEYNTLEILKTLLSFRYRFLPDEDAWKIDNSLISNILTLTDKDYIYVYAGGAHCELVISVLLDEGFTVLSEEEFEETFMYTAEKDEL